MQSHVHAFNKEYRRLLGNISLPAEIAQRFQIESCLSESAKKAAFLVRGLNDGKAYVLKIVSQKSGEDLAAEHALLKSLSHPSIPRAVLFFEKDEWQYLIRDYIPGKTLSSLVEEAGPMPARDAAAIVEQLCGILSYLHRLRPPVIHRDIKPQNILLADDGRCVLIDFGIARRFSGEAKQDTVCMGTQATAAPEQFGYRQTDVRTDEYSTGILLLYLTTGSFDPAMIVNIPGQQLRRIVRRCTRFDPADRYADIERLRYALQRVLHPQRRLFLAGTLAIVLLIVTLSLPQLLLTLAPAAKPAAPADAAQTLAIESQPGAETAYTFASPLIEEAVREQLNLDVGTPVTQADLDRITGLYLCGLRTYQSWDNHDFYSNTDYIDGQSEKSAGSVSTLADVANMPHLSELALYNQMISDLSPLAGLPLTKLGLGGNTITDVSPLSGLTDLSVLDLEKNPLSDISPLHTLYKLESLDLTGTETADISPLEGLPLGYLSLMDCPVQDCSALRGLPKLNWLLLSDVAPEQAAVCGELTYLNNLTLYRCGVTSLEPFSELTAMMFFDLLGNKLTSLDGLERYPLLGGLCIRDNPIEDLSPLTQLPKLNYINLGGLSATDFSPLAALPELASVDCSPDQKEAIERALSGRNVAVNAY